MAMLVLGGSDMAVAAEVSPVPPPRMALGLIVKLKDTKPQSVVRLKASAVPSDGAPRQRQRIADAARRKRVSYLVQRPTAFAANVIHAGHATSWDDANAQAQRLRADPDVEWVVVNEIVRKHSLTVTDPGYVAGDATGNTSLAYLMGNQAAPVSGPGQVWLKSPTSSTQGVADFPAAWTYLQGRTLAPVVVAVLDTGILPHPDLISSGSSRLLPGYDFVDRVLTSTDGGGVDGDPTDTGDWVNQTDKTQHPEVFDIPASPCALEDSTWHGLAISGMLVAKTNNGIYGAGMLAQLSGPNGGPEMLLPVRVGGKCGAEVSSIIEGMLWAAGVSYQGAPPLPAHPAKVINLSFGASDQACTAGAGGAASIYIPTIATLKNNGVLVVAAAGNGLNNRGEAVPSMPANCADVLAVTGLNQKGYKANYANMISDGVAVASGDVDDATYLNDGDAGIYTLSNSGLTSPDLTSSGYIMAAKAGTSFAAPQAVGVAAMMLAVNPNLTVQQLIAGIKLNARPFPSTGLAACVAGNNAQGNCNCTTATCGNGILNAYDAVVWAANAPLVAAAAPIASVSYFTPSRVSATQSSGGGGGGGSLDWSELFGLASLTALAAVFMRRPPAQGRQAAKLLP
ncbi:S8 family serine peptidase [Aquabacterium sp. CECT 9606]|uniref:S8 family serine peptidase n=1 Tax=Aquabacterium sp. CECT 9606 TaxID=2845822 RepID=UPI001E4CDBAD|nr:S8 family serine peptidase [Aquabacterium sp. CECT 9606]